VLLPLLVLGFNRHSFPQLFLAIHTVLYGARIEEELSIISLNSSIFVNITKINAEKLET